MNKKFLIVMIFVIIVPILINCASEGDLSKTEFYYTVNALNPETGLIEIELNIKNLPSKDNWSLYQTIDNKTVNISNIKAKTTTGKELIVKDSGDKYPKRTIVTNGENNITISYDAKVGGKVKHGSQGYVCSSYGLITGDVFLILKSQLDKEKKNKSGISDVKKIRINVNTVNGWGVYTSMEKETDGYNPAINGKWQFTALKYSNIAFGKFDEYQKTIGGVLNRVYLESSWSDEEKEKISRNCFNIFEVFNNIAPFDPDRLPVYTTIFTNGTDRNERVFGSIWAHTQAYAYTPYNGTGLERTPRRVWELYCHRIAHAINRYEIYGFSMDNKFERWFEEGWPSYVEIAIAMEAGAVDKDTRFDELYDWYIRVFTGLDKFNGDVPVYMEYGSADSNITRYLHYFKSPIVTLFLDYEMRRLSNGKKTVNGFVKYFYPKYKNHQNGSVPFLKELNNYMENVKMDYFIEDYVKKTSYFYPIYDGFIERYKNLNISNGISQIVKTINGYDLTLYQYNQIKNFLRTIKISDENQVSDIATEMVLVMEEYKSRNLNIIPKEMIEIHSKIPGNVQYVLFNHQKELMFSSDNEYRSWIDDKMKNLK